MKKRLLALAASFFSMVFVHSQVGINNPLAHSTLEVTAKKTDGTTPEGIIAPRLTGEALHTADLNTQYGELQDGTLAFVTEAPLLGNRVGQTIDINARGYYYYDYPQNKWVRVFCYTDTGIVSGLDCTGAVNNGTLISGIPSSGVSSQIPYTGGNGGVYAGQAVSSTGITGLTATLVGGVFANGNGTLTYNITGTPSGSGTASFAITVGGKSCTFTRVVNAGGGTLSTINCSGANNLGTLTQGLPASGVSSQIPYTGGNGGAYGAQTVSSTGITGLTANLSAGSFANGNGTLTYSITGTPSGSGTASFAINIGGQSCTLSRTVGGTLPQGSGTLAGKTCFDVVMVNNSGECGTLSSRASQKADFSQSATHTQTYTFTPTGTVSNVRFVYVNTNGQVINAITGGNPGNNITGPVTATVNYNTNLNALASGTTRETALTANIILIYNNSANNTGSDVQLTLKVNVQDCLCCGAFIAPGVFKTFMCHNLGADQDADPFIPAAAIHGAKYQWGAQTGEAGRYYSQSQDQSNPLAITGWITSVKPDGSWSDTSKTANDPCPSGYRVPTKAQWEGVISNNNDNINNIERIGTWENNNGNYTTALYFRNPSNVRTLMLPAAGYRYGLVDGRLINRGSHGYYWSSSEATSVASFMRFNSSSWTVDYFGRTYGASVRCIAE